MQTPTPQRTIIPSGVASGTSTPMAPPSFIPARTPIAPIPHPPHLSSLVTPRMPPRSTPNTPIPVSAQSRPTSAQEDLVPPSPNDQHQSVSTLNDAALSAGVNLRREEEQIEESSGGAYKAYYESRTEGWGNVRKQDWIEFGEVTKRVSSVAATFQLRNLEADSIPFLAMAVKARIRSVLQNGVKAQKQRHSLHHLDPPPLRNLKRKREEDGMEIEEKIENVPVWEVEVLSDPGKILETLETLEDSMRNGEDEEGIQDSSQDVLEKLERENTVRDLQEQLAERRKDYQKLRGITTFNGERFTWTENSTVEELPQDQCVDGINGIGMIEPPARSSPKITLQSMPSCRWGDVQCVTMEDVLWGMERENVSSFKKGIMGNWRKEGRPETVCRWQWGVGTQ